MLASKIETYDTAGKGAEQGEDFGVMRGTRAGYHQDDQQNYHDDKQTENRPDGGLQMPNPSLYISVPLAGTARQPFLRINFFLHEWKGTLPRLSHTRIAAIPILPGRAGPCPITVATFDGHKVSTTMRRTIFCQFS